MANDGVTSESCSVLRHTRMFHQEPPITSTKFLILYLAAETPTASADTNTRNSGKSPLTLQQRKRCGYTMRCRRLTLCLTRFPKDMERSHRSYASLTLLS